MDEKNTIETYQYVIDYCTKLGLAYIQLVRYLRELFSYLSDVANLSIDSNMRSFYIAFMTESTTVR